ncbi:hypothetical protein GCM10009802_34960 [Streptomyces synnematoformans]|uniref:Secreted protein n=1 Tax=Streptomyces synnematoformans TaxID=415721 RepID=A0ABP5K9N4_9ACTN
MQGDTCTPFYAWVVRSIGGIAVSAAGVCERRFRRPRGPLGGVPVGHSVSPRCPRQGTQTHGNGVRNPESRGQLVITNTVQVKR